MKTTTYSPAVYWKSFTALAVLLAITWSIGYVDLGSFNLIVALGIGIAKAMLVVRFLLIG